MLKTSSWPVQPGRAPRNHVTPSRDPYTVTRQEFSSATRNRAIQRVHSSNPSMPKQRKTSRRELTPAERTYLVGRRDAGKSFGKISDQTGIPKTTIQCVVKNAQNHNICHECGPRCLESAVRRLLLNHTKLRKENQALRGL